MVTLLTSNIEIHSLSLAYSLKICIFLHQNKNAVVRNTAGATLRQSAINLIERAANEIKANTSVDLKNAQLFSTDAYLFIEVLLLSIFFSISYFSIWEFASSLIFYSSHPKWLQSD